MSKINVRQLTDEEKEKMQVESWGVWKKEVSIFPWSYDTKEQCYIIEGSAVVTDSETGEEAEFGAGDFVEFLPGLKCEWNIKEDIKKYYRFV
ncbi:MAG: cupin domain-containing protein [Patescibacteria group bacterium]